MVYFLPQQQSFEISRTFVSRESARSYMLSKSESVKISTNLNSNLN